MDSKTVKRFLTALAGMALLWFGGFVLFVAGLPKPLASPPAAADGVAVFTGGGGARISSGMAVFAGGAGQRMLISGVHPGTSAERLSDFWTGPRDRFDCCVDLGREALTTEGNANELRNWADAHHYKKIILVTSEYHMPRAMTVTRKRLPDVDLTAYPVASGYLDGKGRPASLGACGKLAGEYTKFLLARVIALLPASGR